MTETARCPFCGGDTAPGWTSSCDTEGEMPVLITHIPALICGQCGEETWTSRVAREIERLVNERPRPSRTVSVPVYELADGCYREAAEVT